MFSRSDPTDQHIILATGILLQKLLNKVTDVLEDEEGNERDTGND
jgi:hypothetical protein